MQSGNDLRFPAVLRGSLLLVLIPLASCTLRPHKQAAVPPPPKPASAQQPTPDAPLSIPQTAVTLPSAQVVNPSAIPEPPIPPTPSPEKEEAPASPRVTRRPASVPPKAEPEQPAAPPPAAVEQPPFQPILSAEERKRLQGGIEGRRHEIEEVLARAKGHLSEHDQSLVDRINSFLKLADEAAQRDDYTQAYDLTDRAVILARELKIE